MNIEVDGNIVDMSYCSFDRCDSPHDMALASGGVALKKALDGVKLRADKQHVVYVVIAELP